MPADLQFNPSDKPGTLPGEARSAETNRSLDWRRWLNQVELWFAKIQRDVITRGVFTSVSDLGNKLRKYIRAYSKSAKPFRWTYTETARRIRPNKIAGTAY